MVPLPDSRPLVGTLGDAPYDLLIWKSTNHRGPLFSVERHSPVWEKYVWAWTPLRMTYNIASTPRYQIEWVLPRGGRCKYVLHAIRWQGRVE